LTEILHFDILFASFLKGRPMPPPDRRGDAPRAFDAHADDFIRDCASRFEAGGAIAALDVERLIDLAGRLARDLAAWTRALETLDLAKARRLAPDIAGRLLVESVFDEALTPAGTRILAAALDLALSGPAVSRD